MTALGVASYVGLGVGFSPGKVIANAMMKRRQVTELRVLFADLPGCCGYKLMAHGVPIEQMDSKMGSRVHELLNAAAYSVLGRRSSLGWGASYTRPKPVMAAISMTAARNQPCRTNCQTSVGETACTKSYCDSSVRIVW